jgi:hypothetical protein
LGFYITWTVMCSSILTGYQLYGPAVGLTNMSGEGNNRAMLPLKSQVVLPNCLPFPVSSKCHKSAVGVQQYVKCRLQEIRLDCDWLVTDAMSGSYAAPETRRHAPDVSAMASNASTARPEKLADGARQRNWHRATQQAILTAKGRKY